MAVVDHLMSQVENPLKDVNKNEGIAIDFLSIGVQSKYMGRKIGSRIAELAFRNG